MSITGVAQVSQDYTKPRARSIRPLTFSSRQCILQLPSDPIWRPYNGTGKHVSDYSISVWPTSEEFYYFGGKNTIPWPAGRLLFADSISLLESANSSICWLLPAQGVILMVLIAAAISDCFYSSEVAVATINTRQQQSHHWMGLKWQRQNGHGKMLQKVHIRGLEYFQDRDMEKLQKGPISWFAQFVKVVLFLIAFLVYNMYSMYMSQNIKISLVGFAFQSKLCWLQEFWSFHVCYDDYGVWKWF